MKAALAIVCLAAATSASAAPGPATIDEAKAAVAAAVQRYLDAVACPGPTVNPADVLALVPEQDGETRPKFAVLWTGDLGCYGGSGTVRTNLAIATVNSGHAVVLPELSSPVVEFESPVRFVSRVVGHGADTLVLEGKERAPLDAHNFPTVPVRFTLRLDAKGNWKLADKVGIASH